MSNTTITLPKGFTVGAGGGAGGCGSIVVEEYYSLQHMDLLHLLRKLNVIKTKKTNTPSYTFSHNSNSGIYKRSGDALYVKVIMTGGGGGAGGSSGNNK